MSPVRLTRGSIRLPPQKAGEVPARTILAGTAATNISPKLVSGPARPTISMSRRGFRSRAGLTGTGLAHPSTGRLASTAMAGRMIDPSGSMWGTGLSVRRPARLAVSSP